MKKFLAIVFIFIALVIAVFIGLEFLMFSVPNEFSLKKDALEINGDRWNMIILGASHSANCIDPNVMGDSTFNVASSARAYYYDCKIVQQYVPKMKNLKYVVMSVAPFQQYRSFKYNINRHDGLGAQESTQRCMYLKYWGFHYDKYDWVYWSEFLNSRFATFGRLYSNNSTNCDERGFQELKQNTRKNNWAELQIPTPIDWDNEMLAPAYLENLINMKKMVKTCQQYGVIPVFVTIPYWETGYNNMPQRDIDSLNSFIMELKITNPQVRYLNYMKDNRFGVQDFYNASHLNDVGARKFSTILYDDIINN